MSLPRRLSVYWKSAAFLFRVKAAATKIYKHKSSGKRVTVPYHAGKILHLKVLKNILADAGMTDNDLEKSLE